MVHAIPPRTDDGIWKHSLVELNRCYASLWEFAERLKATRIAVQLIPLGSTPSLQRTASEILVEQVLRFRSSQQQPATVRLVAPSTAMAIALASKLSPAFSQSVGEAKEPSFPAAVPATVSPQAT